MDGERCRWFEDEWGLEIPMHMKECPYSEKYLVEGTRRCIFHLPRGHKEKSKHFEGALIDVLSNGALVWTDVWDKDTVKYIDCFDFIFPVKFPLYVVLDRYPPEFPLCLVGAQLQGADLVLARLHGANLRRADLQGAVLTRAHLQGADLRWAHLQGAVLTRAHLQCANLLGAHLQGAHLYKADLQGADLRMADLQGADLSLAHLQGADLGGAHLQGAGLCWAQLQGADLRRAQLQGANLSIAHLQGADLSHARFCADPGYRPGEEWDKWIEDSENNLANYRLIRGKKLLTGGLDAASMDVVDLGAGQCKGKTRIKLTATENKYREITYQKMKKHVGSRGIVTPVYNENNEKEIEAVELELTPAVLKGTDLRSVDLSESTIAGADFTSARLDGTLFRSTNFGGKYMVKNKVESVKYDVKYVTVWTHRWSKRNKWRDRHEWDENKLRRKLREPGRIRQWLIRLPLVGRVFSIHEQPIFAGANLEAADWADNRRAQRDFVYAEYIRQFKKRHPVISFFWWALADYGRSFFRWAFWSLVIAVAFGCVYWLHLGANQFIYAEGAQLSECWRCFYYSIVTFTTLGFGDVVPKTDAASIWVAVEVILGYVMLGGLISIFAVKVARRD